MLSVNVMNVKYYVLNVTALNLTLAPSELVSAFYGTSRLALNLGKRQTSRQTKINI